MREFEGVPMLAPEKAGPIYIRWATPECDLSATLLDDIALTVPVHWCPVEGQRYRVTRRCFKPASCDHCRLGIAGTVAAYLPAWSHNERKYIAIPFSPDSWATLEKAFPREECFRGARIIMRRTGSGASSPLAIFRQGTPLSPLPECPDIRPMLRSMFGADLFPCRHPHLLSDEQGGCS